MSVLSFPRVYFKGFMCWDPATANNNDYFPTYDDVRVALNWDFFRTHEIDINTENYPEKFRPWATEVQTIDITQPDGTIRSTPAIPAEWNYFGGNAAYFVRYDDQAKGIKKQTLVTGGVLEDGTFVDNDPLIGKPVVLSGNPFGDPAGPSPGRLVDNNPVSTYDSQIYFKSLALGDATTGIAGAREHRMQARFLNFTRNFNIGAAGGASVTWQTCFAKGDGLEINNPGDSPLLKALEEALDAPNARGVMVEFNTYLNLYFQNGYFNDFQPQPKANDELPPLYRQALGNEIDLFSNPCYSRVAGVIGVWHDDDVATVPNGRYLVPTDAYLCNPKSKTPCWDSAAPQDVAQERPFKGATDVTSEENSDINVPQRNLKPAVQLGVSVAKVDFDHNILSLDLLNTFPEWYWEGEKADFGAVTIGVHQNDAFSPILSDGKPLQLTYAAYSQAAYERSAGLVDLHFDDSQETKIREGQLSFQVSPETWTATLGSGGYSSTSNKIVLTEVPLTAQVDRRSSYLDQNMETEISVEVRLKGAPVASAKILVAKYNPSDPPNASSPVAIIPAGGPQIVDFTTGKRKIVKLQTDNKKTEKIGTFETWVTVVDADDKGTAIVGLKAASAGFPVLVFYPFLDGEIEPAPAPEFTELGTGFFATLRVFPFDDTLVDKFVELWNANCTKPDAPEIAWNFVYNEILYVYDMLYPVMLKFMPLGQRDRVEGAIDQLLVLISSDYEEESTLAMPITRDLSAGKRKILRLWGNLVKRGYPTTPISKEAASV